uniref:NADH dehydrogenase [ubiquinone] 1 alpha subcomplex subunit 3 n=1 Tax=Panthera leo TaxID=9689 RepID=A0A8C8XSK2_PANLE
MAGRCTTFREDAWAKELVLVASFAIGGLAVILPPPQPLHQILHYHQQGHAQNYPVPVCDHRNTPHPLCPAALWAPRGEWRSDSRASGSRRAPAIM